MVVIEEDTSNAKVGVKDLAEGSREAEMIEENKVRERKTPSSEEAQQEQMAQLLGSLLGMGGANIPKYHNEDMDDDDDEEAEQIAKHYEIPEETQDEVRARSRRNFIVLVLIVLSGLATMCKNGEDSPFAAVQNMLFGGKKGSSRPRTAPQGNTHHKRETEEEQKARKLKERMEKRRKDAYERERQNMMKYSTASPKAGEKMKSKKKKGKNSKKDNKANTADKGKKPAKEQADDAKRTEAEEEMDRWRASIEEELEL